MKFYICNRHKKLPSSIALLLLSYSHRWWKQPIDTNISFLFLFLDNMSITDAIYNHNNELLLKIIEDAKQDPVLHKKLSQNNTTTLLHLSISVHNYDALQILLDNKIGGDVVTEDAAGRMPLHLAVEKHSYECVNILCTYIVTKKPKWLSLILQKRDKKNNLPIFFACRYPKILNLLIKAVSDTLDNNNNNSLSVATILGVTEKQISSAGLTPLHIVSSDHM